MFAPIVKPGNGSVAKSSHRAPYVPSTYEFLFKRPAVADYIEGSFYNVITDMKALLALRSRTKCIWEALLRLVLTPLILDQALGYRPFPSSQQL